MVVFSRLKGVVVVVVLHPLLPAVLLTGTIYEYGLQYEDTNSLISSNDKSDNNKN